MLNAAFNSIAEFDDGSDTPKTYKDVLKHKNKKEWWDYMKKDFHALETKGEWEIVVTSSMPPGRNAIGNRWVYNKKDDGTLRSQKVAQGFSQLPGQDFTNSHAPVMTDLSFQLAPIT
jgi:Reverse transcriptase (RNA-dependent DNA polymerase)